MDFLSILGSGFLYSLMVIITVVVIILAALTMIMELAGWTISGGRFKKHGLKWNAKSFSIAAIVAAISVALQPFQIILIPGVSGISPSKALAPIFSVMFGLPGMVGATFSMPLQDAVGGWLSLWSVGFFASTWLALCWLPYKLIKDPSFRTTKSWVNYYIVAIIIGPIIHALVGTTWGAMIKVMPPEVVYSVVVPTVMMNHGLTAAVIAPALLLLTFPKVKAMGLYWRDTYGKNLENGDGN